MSRCFSPILLEPFTKEINLLVGQLAVTKYTLSNANKRTERTLEIICIASLREKPSSAIVQSFCASFFFER